MIFIQILLQQESEPLSLAFGIDSKAGREVGKLYKSGKSGKGLLAWESWSPATRIRGCFMWLLWEAYLAFSDWSQVGSRGKSKEVGSLWLFWSNCCRSCGLAFWASCVVQSSVVIYSLAVVRLYILVSWTVCWQTHWSSGGPFILVCFLPQGG